MFGLLCAAALTISYLESLIPPLVSIPGVKPGFSNIVTMFSVSALGIPYGVAVTLFKGFFALITRGLTASVMSLSGGFLSLIAMIILLRLLKNKFGYIGIGIICALAHNLGQLAVAVVILGEAIIGITPLLLISALISGSVTGAIFALTLPALEKRIPFENTLRKE